MRKLVIGCAVAALVAGTAGSMAKPPASFTMAPPIPSPVPATRIGVASWYGEKFQGSLTANGEAYDMNGLTAACWELPFGTRLRVTNLQNRRSVVLRVNDRGPAIHGRAIDVSMAAATHLGFLAAGLAPVEMRVISLPAGWEAKRRGTHDAAQP